jgi:hypothetical protein
MQLTSNYIVSMVYISIINSGGIYDRQTRVSR